MDIFTANCWKGENKEKMTHFWDLQNGFLKPHECFYVLITTSASSRSLLYLNCWVYQNLVVTSISCAISWSKKRFYNIVSWSVWALGSVAHNAIVGSHTSTQWKTNWLEMVCSIVLSLSLSHTHTHSLSVSIPPLVTRKQWNISYLTYALTHANKLTPSSSLANSLSIMHSVSLSFTPSVWPDAR